MIIIECSDDSQLRVAGSKIRKEGRTVVFPTDTVYGLGSSPFSIEGVGACFKLKGRDHSKPFPVLFSSLKNLRRYAEVDSFSESLAGKFWPGALTLILRARSDIDFPQGVLKDNTIAARIPDHDCCLRLIEACGGSLIGTSANISGQPSFTKANDPSLLALARSCDYFIEGLCGGRRPSTIVSNDKEIGLRILREGAIPASIIFSHLGMLNKTDFSSSNKANRSRPAQEGRE